MQAAQELLGDEPAAVSTVEAELLALLNHRHDEYGHLPPPPAVGPEAEKLYLDLDCFFILGWPDNYDYGSAITRISSLDSTRSALRRERCIRTLQHFVRHASRQAERELASRILQKHTTPESPAEGTQND